MAYKYGSNNGKDMEQKFILECIRLYRDLPALWNMKSKSYYERGKKNASYNILLKKYREVYPDATKLDIRKKFNVLRTNYRKEFRKQNSMNSYKPTLWYFNEFSFLNEQKPDIESSIDLSQEDGVSDSESSVSAEVLQNDNLIIKVEHDKETNTVSSKLLYHTVTVAYRVNTRCHHNKFFT
ncbi:unnamed protein product [Diatraea saccharalis]|uniref:MADF domain-containing protein n=1 Tax=Diatraea saccharalis TaxID=40085 RepID=A0A9N9R152_9NEOP|nr:unnamed protein product [Diatraea saccharalis]